MCGIAGGADLGRESAVPPDVLTGMLASIRHRGPDDEGTYVGRHASLGVRRLAIVDVAGGHQPIANEDCTAWVVLNGEIFNYPDLRTRLLERGHRFTTRSDTEAIVHAYEEWGEECVDQLNGQFAFAIWDVARRQLLLARDRVGIKPLHYWHQDGLLLFGSEIKALLAHPSVPREIDHQALDQYLTYEHVPVPRTLFKGIWKLPPGHMLRLNADGMQIRQYWDIELHRGERHCRGASVQEWEERLRDALRQAVALELMSDVPLGVFLSGGLDSSTVSAFMAREMGSRVRSFSIGFEDPSFDESGFARQVAAHLGLEHREEVLSERAMYELVPKLADTLDEPLGDSSFVPCFLLSQFARRHVTVALGGDGGDELLAGYSTLQAHRLASYYRWLPRPVRQGVIAPLVRRIPVSHNNLSFDFKAKRFVAAAERPAPERHHLWLGSFSPEEKEGLLSERTRRQVQEDSFRVARDHFERAGCEEDLNRVLYMDTKLYLDTDILTKVDRSSMAHSLEARVPLLNQVMLDLAAGMPLDLKLRRFTRKYLLRRTMRGVLPAHIIERPKKGFNIPMARWFRGALKDLVLDLLSEGRLAKQGIFRPHAVRGLIDDHMDGVKDNRKLLWTLLVFQLWYDRWLEPRG